MTAEYQGGNASREPSRFPSWLKAMNGGISALQRLGFVVGPTQILTVPGRRSGIHRSTPVSLMTVAGERYIIAAVDDADWAQNARAVGRGILRRGRIEEHVSLVELPVAERAPILREFPRLVPGGVYFFKRLHGVAADPEAIAALARVCPVYRVGRD